MTINSISDLSQSLLLRRDNAELRRLLVDASRELSTGRQSDIPGHLGGDIAQLADIEAGLRKSESLLFNVGEQRLLKSSAQATLASVRQSMGDLSSAMLIVRDTADADLVRIAGQDAVVRFEGAVASFNTSVGGVSIFAGIASDTPALAAADSILSALETEIALAGAATADDVRTVVRDWFAPGGGYDVAGYTGGPLASVPVSVSGTLSVDPLVTAEALPVRNSLSALATAALIGRGVLTGDPAEEARLAQISGLDLVAADESLVELQATIGQQENRIARAEVETRAQMEVLETARSDLIGVDPFDAATRLQAVETQLESLYTLTARLSRLSLTNVLR